MFPHNKYNLLCKFLCLAPISSNQLTQRALSAYSLCSIVGVVLAMVFGLTIDLYGKGFIVSSLATSAVFISAVIAHITTVSESLFKREEHEQFFAKLHELEDIFRFKLRHKTQDEANAYRRKIIFKYSVMSFIVILSLGIYTYTISNHHYEGYFWHACVPEVVSRIRFIQASVYVDLISFWFDHMNSLLEQISSCRFQQKNRMLDVDYGVIDNPERIYVLKSVYTKLNDLVFCFNEAYGWSILATTIYLSLDLTCNMYWVFMSCDGLMPNYNVYESYLIIFPIGLLLFLFSHTCSMCVNKSEVTKQLIQKMLLTALFDHTNYLLDAFLFQIYNRPIVFHAKRVFYINLRLLTSIAVSMVGYLVILIQFQLTENQI